MLANLKGARYATFLSDAGFLNLEKFSATGRVQSTHRGVVILLVDYCLQACQLGNVKYCENVHTLLKALHMLYINSTKLNESIVCIKSSSLFCL